MHDTPDHPPVLTPRPILDHDLDRVALFFQTHLNQKLSLAVWKNAFCQPWLEDPPNHGFMFLDQERVVGAFGALYSEQIIRGQKERFCNPNSWIVLKPYRHQSLNLFHALLEQKGFHFSTLTSNKSVTRICQFKQFKFMNNQMTVIPNLPWPVALKSKVIDDHQQVISILTPDSALDYRRHQVFPWLGQVALGQSGSYCHVVFKRKKWKRMHAAVLLHISDPEIFLRHYPAFGRYLLWHDGVTTIHIPTRFLPHAPSGSFTIVDTQPRMFLSDRLTDRDFTFLYTEVVALDLML